MKTFNIKRIHSMSENCIGLKPHWIMWLLTVLFLNTHCHTSFQYWSQVALVVLPPHQSMHSPWGYYQLQQVTNRTEKHPPMPWHAHPIQTKLPTNWSNGWRNAHKQVCAKHTHTHTHTELPRRSYKHRNTT